MFCIIMITKAQYCIIKDTSQSHSDCGFYYLALHSCYREVTMCHNDASRLHGSLKHIRVVNEDAALIMSIFTCDS
jgi:hypothetical protein